MQTIKEHEVHRRKTMAALAATSALLAGCGGADESVVETSGAPGNGADRAFVEAMVPHHRSAVEMARIAQERGESEFVRDLADDIVRTQRAEIAVLRDEDRELAQAGVEVGSLGVPEHAMGMDDDAAMLEDADPFDEEFLEMMVPHHEGAIEMAKAQIARGADPELKDLARSVIAAQQDEIERMRAWQAEDGSEASGPDTKAEGHGGH